MEITENKPSVSINSQRVIFSKLNERKLLSKNRCMGPEMAQIFSHRPSHFERDESARISSDLVERSRSAGESFKKKIVIRSKEAEPSNNSEKFQGRRKKPRKRTLSKYVKQVMSGSPKNRGKSQQSNLSLAHLTLEDLLFRQKLVRFIKNLRAHAGLNEASKLNSSKLKIIDDRGAFEREILNQGFISEMQERNSRIKGKSNHRIEKEGIKKIFLRNINTHTIRLKSTIQILTKAAFFFIDDHLPILKPFGKFKIFWDILMLVLTFWNLISFSLIISFKISLQESVSLSVPFLNNSLALFLFQGVCLVLYYTDIMIKLSTSYYCDGEQVTERRKIFKKYIRGGLIFDLLGTVPFWQYVLDSNSDGSQVLFFILFKLYPLQVFFKNINEALLSIEGRLEAAYYLGKLLMTVLVVCHIFACLWHYQAFVGSDYSKNWLQTHGLRNSLWSERYLRSLYFTIVTMTTVGYGDISPSNPNEYLVSMCCMLLGSGLIGYSVNSIGAILKKKNKGELEFRNKMQLLNSFLRKNRVEENLEIRIRKYLEYVWKKENFEREKKCEEILKDLPKSLHEELLTQTRIMTVRALFSGKLSEQTLKSLVRKFSVVHFSKEEWIFKEGDFNENSLFIVVSGNVDIVYNQVKKDNNNHLFVDSLNAGEELGLWSFIVDAPREFSAKAASVCSLFKIDRKDFIKIIKENKDDYERFCMLRDKSLLSRDLRTLGKKCKSCGELNHVTVNCPCLNYQPFKCIIIKRHLFSRPQRRRKYFRIKKSMNSLLMSENLREVLKKFQEERAELINNLVESQILSVDLAYFYHKEFNRSWGRTESKDQILNAREEEEGNNNFATKLNEQISHENDVREKRERSMSLLPIRINHEQPVGVESYSEIEQSPKATAAFTNHPVGSHHHFSVSEDLERAGEEIKASTSKKTALQEKTDKRIEEENSDILTRNKKAKQASNFYLPTTLRESLYNREFDAGHVFSFYFPYNNKTDVISKFNKASCFSRSVAKNF